jgi:RNA polymerase sigma-70 factor (ECF subfamily)
MIARKRLYSFLRTQHRKQPADLGSTSVADLGVASPSRIVGTRQEQRLLLQALRKLPIDMQVALELFYWEELTVFEIADVLETPVGTIKSRLQRARSRLDQLIAELSESETLLRSTMDNFEMWAKDLQGQLAPKHDAGEG